MVTVLMPVYNGEKYLKEAIDSVLNQTYEDFEFLIINDGSSDNSVNIIKSYNDPRIKLINNEINLRLIATLNLGLEIAQGKYIARMDCDDICFPERLMEQVKFMESNPDVGIAGSWFIRSDNKKLIKRPVDSEEVKVSLLKGAMILHPTAIFRKEFFDKYNLKFNNEFIHAEDYELWVRASEKFKLANIPKPLLEYRKHPKQISQSFAKEQKETTIKIITYHLKNLGLEPSADTAILNLQLFSKSKLNNKQVKKLATYVDLLIAANDTVRYYDPKVFNDFLIHHKAILWDRCQSYSFKTLGLYHYMVGENNQKFSIKIYIKILKRIAFNTIQLMRKGFLFSS